MASRKRANALDAPFSVYEIHLGSWMRPQDDPAGFLNYREMAQRLARLRAEDRASRTSS